MTNQTLCIIILIIVCVFILGYLYYQIRKNGLRATVVELIVYAEKTLGNGTGKEKMELVIDKFSECLPAPIRMFITKEAILQFTQHVFDEIKEALDYGNK